MIENRTLPALFLVLISLFALHASAGAWEKIDDDDGIEVFRQEVPGSSFLDKTRVVVEIHTDPKGDLPAWIVNMIQKSWPRNTLMAFAKQAAKPHVKALELPPEG